MARKGILLTLVAGAFLMAGSAGYAASVISKEAEPVFAAPSSGSPITSNINLNDTPEAEIRSYYSALNEMEYTERTGTNLLKNLKPILQEMTYFNYDNVWKIYEITDRDWNLSPASGDAEATYDSSTNTYTSYTYGSNSVVNNNPYIHAIYRNRDSSGSIVEAGRIRAWGTHETQAGFNREHVWPQSRGFKASSGASGPAGTDVHHLMAGDARVNQYHHNAYCYGNVDTTQEHESGDSTYTYLEGNLQGKPSNTNVSDSNVTVFEPQDSDKGDIARACFYMVACYNNYSGTETITQFNPNLVLIDDIYDANASELSSAETPVSMGILSDLLEWNRLDPPDEYEIHRNNLIYENYQLNRNPFVDFPEWAEYVWGDKKDDGVADPTSDTLNKAFDGGKSISGEGGGEDPEPSVPGETRTLSGITGTTNRVLYPDTQTNSYNKKVFYVDGGTDNGDNSYAFGGFYVQASASNGGGFQLNGNHSTASSQHIANYTPLSGLTEIEIKLNATSDGGFTLKAGTSRLPSSGTTITGSLSTDSLTYTYTLDGTNSYFYLTPTGTRPLYFTISLTFKDVASSITTADAYGSTFLALTDGVCDATGETETLSSGTWAYLDSIYDTWTDIGTGFADATANPDGGDLANAAARYDMAVANHTTLTNFAQRNTSASSLHRQFMDSEGNILMILIPAVAILFTFSLAYVALRRKSRNR